MNRRNARRSDPLGGSYFLEKLTLQMEKGAFDYFGKLDAMGGMLRGSSVGTPQKKSPELLIQYQRAAEAKEKHCRRRQRFRDRRGIAAHSLTSTRARAAAVDEVEGFARPSVDMRKSDGALRRWMKAAAQ